MIDIDKLIMESLKKGRLKELSVYRAIKTKMILFKTSKNAPEYNESAELQLLDKMRKERLDSATQYREGNRIDLAEIEENEAKIIDSLLPHTPTKFNIFTAVVSVCNKYGFTANENSSIEDLLIPKKEMGKVIKEVKEILPLADGKLISEIVKMYLV